MPKQPNRDDLEAGPNAWDEFESPTKWHRSSRGNLCRQWDGLTLTVFSRGGGFGWSYKDEDEGELRYSKTMYECEEDAMMALGTARE